MKHIKFLPILAAAVAMTTASCTDPIENTYDKETYVPHAPEELIDSIATNLADYKCPTYEDDYTSISSWANRYQWNLANVHDPTVMLAEDGYYYMYQTDASYGNVHSNNGHFHARRSKNLVDWQYMGATANEKAFTWVKDTLNAQRARVGLAPIYNPSLGYWAPCARKVRDGLYRMYYSIVVDNYIGSGAQNKPANFDSTWTERAYIGVMECSDPALNQWEDKGYVICSSSDKGKDWHRNATDDYTTTYFRFNAIDPSYIITSSGEHWLIYGSWHSGIAAVQLNPETGKTLNPLSEPWGEGADAIASYGTQIFSRDINSRWQATEAPEIVEKDGYFYLFLANDGLDVPYNTTVLRSKKITGPYETMNGAVTDATAQVVGDNATVLTHPYKFADTNADKHGWVGISHCAVFDDGNGNYYYASQQRFPKDFGGNSSSNAIMMGGVRSIKWLSNGWPTVMPERYGKVPQEAINDSEIAGTWEHIDLGYKYGVQKEASEMVFGTDHTITSGAWKGASWSFDASTNTLKVGNVELKVQREVDWEASPRKVTIVYSGLNGAKSYWGKKK